jgi:DNA-binding transcriptional regulator GbsR (MarR family)
MSDRVAHALLGVNTNLCYFSYLCILSGMKNDALLTYADHAGRFYARQYGIPPMAGRLLGYLTVCEPEHQSINELADALMASRSAIVGAVQVLENVHIVKRTRIAGKRSDSISVDVTSFEGKGFDAVVYQEQAALFREGLALLKGATAERQARLEELVHFAEFLAKRMPALQKEWYEQRDAMRKASKKGECRRPPH